MSDSKYKRLLQFIIRASLTWALLYLAFIENVAGAYNIVHALAWIAAALSPFLLAEASKANLKKHPKDFIYSVDKIDDFFIACALIWFGSIATGIVWIIATGIAIAAKEAAHEEA